MYWTVDVDAPAASDELALRNVSPWPLLVPLAAPNGVVVLPPGDRLVADQAALAESDLLVGSIVALVAVGAVVVEALPAG
jgi:hypothetical protein